MTGARVRGDGIRIRHCPGVDREGPRDTPPSAEVRKAVMEVFKAQERALQMDLPFELGPYMKVRLTQWNLWPKVRAR